MLLLNGISPLCIYMKELWSDLWFNAFVVLDYDSWERHCHYSYVENEKKTLSIPKMFPAILFHSNSPDLFKLISARKNENTLYRWRVDCVKYTCIAFLSIIHVVKRSALIMFTSKIIVLYVTKYLLYFKIWQSTCE